MKHEKISSNNDNITSLFSNLDAPSFIVMAKIFRAECKQDRTQRRNGEKPF